MPYVEGESLKTRLERVGALPLNEVLSIARDVAEALEYAHRQDVVHRDIKPGNILLHDDHALVVDFGIASAIAEARTDTLTQTGQAIGTPAYMAPEQFYGETTPRSDVYALGAVLYEALCGRRFPNLAIEEPDWAGVDPTLRPILERALSLSPGDRWPDATTFREAIEALARPQAGQRRLLGWRNVTIAGAAAALVWAGVALGWLDLGRGEDADSQAVAEESAVDLRSIAVLPFATRATREDEEAVIFSEGMHDDLLTQLAKIDSLRVISRTSVMQYAGTKKTIGTIADELGVSTVLEGGVQRAGDRVRVNVQLIDANTDEHLWAETYDVELTAAHVFAIQADLTKKIAAALRATLTPEVETRLAAPPTESLEAYDLYTRARFIVYGPRGQTREAWEEVAELLRQAVEADPDYALAYAGLADIYLALWSRGHLPPEEALAVAGPAVDKALALDPTLAQAHTSHGKILSQQRRYEEAERAHRRAIELNPGSATAHSVLGSMLVGLGRFEAAAAEHELAVQLDPLSRTARALSAFTYAMSRQYDRAIVQSRKLIELDPGFNYGYYVLGLALSFSGEHEEAIAALSQSTELSPDEDYALAALAFTHARAGNRQKALELVVEVEERLPAEIAWVHGALGDVDRAF